MTSTGRESRLRPARTGIQMNSDGYYPQPCGKKVKGQTDAGEWLCGVHLGAYNRVKKNRRSDRQQNLAANGIIRTSTTPHTKRIGGTVRYCIGSIYSGGQTSP